jgi:hypothetical protein
LKSEVERHWQRERERERESTFIVFMLIETDRILNDSEGSQAVPDHPSGKGALETGKEL